MFVKYLQCVNGYIYILSLISHTTAAMYITNNARHSEILGSALFKHFIENLTDTNLSSSINNPSK